MTSEQTVDAPAEEEGAAAPAEPGASAERASAPDPETTPWTGRQAWAFPALTAAFGAVSLYGAFTITAPPHAAPPGPSVFPAVVGVLLLATAAAMAVVNLRATRGAAVPTGPPTEWRPVLIVVGALVAHTAVLEALGWLLAGAGLFWAVAFAFGARSPLRDIVVALSMSAAVQVGFSLGLGLALPGGVLELVL